MAKHNVPATTRDLPMPASFGSPRALTMAALLAVMVALPSTSAHSQANYPSKPVRFVIVVAPGGGADAVGRILAARLFPMLGQPVVVENRTGAGGNIASEYVARSAPDGYSLLLTSNNHNVNPLIYQRPGYDARKEFVPVVQLTQGPSVLVTPPDSGFKSLKELVDTARAKPKSLSYGSSGIGLPTHIATEMLKQAANIDIVHVPYKGGNQALNDTISGQVAMYFPGVPVALPMVKAGKVRAFATTGPKRLPVLPDVPTLAEAGVPGYQVILWYGLLGPAGLSNDVTAKIHADVARVLKMPDVHERLAGLGVEPVGSAPEAYAAFLRSEIAKWDKVKKATGLTID